MRFLRVRWLGLVICLPLGGCSNFGEKHYFRSVDGEGRTVNYYRLWISGHAMLNSSRYISGYFDERVVDEYFGQIIQPENAKFIRPCPEADKGKEVRVESAGGDKSTQGQALLLMLSTNSDEIVNQLSTLAESKETTALIARLANKDTLTAARKAEDDLAVQKEKAKALVAQGESLAKLGEDAVAADSAKAALLAWVNSFAVQHGETEMFTDLSKAVAWFQANRGRLIKE
jgi:hypothetical protein